ncbi:hypothetical protein HYV30_00425 [Candidatus Kaiserbacteria bacterium]|nr:hypothetical protein [Candidatus Kaiserbacteria bacterium]
MSWGLVGVIVIVFALIGTVLASLRFGGRRSRQMMQTQTQINRRSAVAAPTVQTPQPGGVPQAVRTPRPEEPRAQQSIPTTVLYTLRTVLALAALLILYFGVFTATWEAPTPAALGAWAWDRWFWLIVAYVLVDVFAATYRQAQVTWFLRRIGIGAAVGLFVLLPIALWLGIGSKEEKVSRTPAGVSACPDVSSRETRGCLVREVWSNWIKPAEGTAVDGMQVCYDPPELIIFEYDIKDGTSFLRFKAKQGEVVMKYVLRRLPDGKTCPPI